ncbi:MAG: hypothetical protein SOW36_00890 [Porphyromonas sp.]|uniref:hypothetical protein n=1 Tax=Porphyromonas sp. TaxID=1924944 RepID=UPI002A7542F5|nr:hypothetical protein [Porphyromonas sp.]MDD6928522.1 hypothetical protein [Bacteroidales bacterium]MDY3111185.1 hypothetical protein [Porphyromonas sp.]MDY4246559.1 hypothetical protein [Porphyromonas sp.]
MVTPLKRWWTSLGHSVHSPTAFRLITLVLDQRGIAYYPEHLEELPEGANHLNNQQKQLALQLLYQWPLTQIVTQYDKALTYDRALILWQGSPLAEMPWDSGSLLWHTGRKVLEPFRQRKAGMMVDYAGGQLLFLDRKLPRQDFWTRIRH